MATWNHRMCGDCWLKRELKIDDNGDVTFRVPTMLKDEPSGLCCFCSNMTQLGIFVRHDPKTLTCDEKHKSQEGEQLT